MMFLYLYFVNYSVVRENKTKWLSAITGVAQLFKEPF
jgi:hypothetical protein